MEEIKHNLAKEQYIVDLLGYSLVESRDGYWLILDENKEKAGYVEYSDIPKNEPRYYTIIYKNNVKYDYTRIAKDENDRYFHYEFKSDNGDRTNFILDLANPNRSINIWLTTGRKTYLFELSWKVSRNDYGFDISLGEFVPPKTSKQVCWYECRTISFMEFSGYPEKCRSSDSIDGKYEDISIDEYLENHELPIVLISQFNCIMSKFFKKSLSEIIGEEDLRRSGLNVIFNILEKDKKSIQKKLRELNS